MGHSMGDNVPENGEVWIARPTGYPVLELDNKTKRQMPDGTNDEWLMLEPAVKGKNSMRISKFELGQYAIEIK